MSLNGWISVAEEVARKVLRDAGVTPVVRAGTVVSRDPDSNAVSVVFDGDAGQVLKVKCMTNVEVYPSDRVTLIAVKTALSAEWLVVGTFGVASVARALLLFGWTTSGVATSTSFVDMPESPVIPFTKRYTASYLEVDMRLTARVDTANTAAACGVAIDGVDYEVVKSHIYNVASVHGPVSGIMDCAQGLAAGDYTISGRWRRTAGAGQLIVDANDRLTIKILERR